MQSLYFRCIQISNWWMRSQLYSMYTPHILTHTNTMSDLSILVVCLLQIFWKLPASTVSQFPNLGIEYTSPSEESIVKCLPDQDGFSVATPFEREIHGKFISSKTAGFLGTLPLRCSMVLICFNHILRPGIATSHSRSSAILVSFWIQCPQVRSTS
jgi:hypothetical protein